MTRKTFRDLSERIISGDIPSNSEYLSVLSASPEDLPSLLQGADMLRNEYFGRKIHLCAICNGKSGRCTEDCVFCSQSAFAKTESPVYPLMEKDELLKSTRWASEMPINRFSIVTSGRGVSTKEVTQIAEAISDSDKSRLKYCVSLGILYPDDLEILKNAGVTRYHHNLETSRSLFGNVCTTHTYDDRIRTIKAAKHAGLSVCAGGIFGIGETDEQILELAFELKELDADAVPMNFLIPIKGTRAEKSEPLTPFGCLKIIAFFRYVLPEKEIIICGGREKNLRQLHPMIFHAGASGVMTGNYLTAKGRTIRDDLEMLEDLHFGVRQ